MATQKVCVYRPLGPVKVVWLCTICCTLTEGTTSHGIVVASITPLESASPTAGTGMPTGTAPICSSMMLITREPPRTRMPLMSSSLFTGLRLWIRPGPWMCVQISLTSANSSMALAWMYSWNASEPGSALPVVNGSSKASALAKRPGV